jgi:hypothetical protein
VTRDAEVGQGTQAPGRVALLRRILATLLGAAVVGLAVFSILRPGPVPLALLIIGLYLAGRLALRGVLARHDRPRWAPVAAGVAGGRIDEALLAQTLPGLAHPGLRSAAAVALAHLRADRADWEGVAAYLPRMGPLCRAVIASSLAVVADGDGVAIPVRIMVLRARVAVRTRLGSGLPSETLFCAVAVLHGRGFYQRAFATCRRAWRARPEAVMAYSCACALARGDRQEQALEWLRRALAAGYPAADLAGDDDLVGLRPLPAFRALAGGAPDVVA